ncbi:MAG: peptidoglycan DD-metalloendopeptidase family protein [Woeseiaceae bacterium]|nr:peptidoglycan DD-metalloendopeptidase family protein [Woeseiaceae bacterium]
MRRLFLLSLVLVALSATANQEAEQRAVIKEQELEQVRSRISRLKASMDEAARERDRLTADLQSAEVEIGEKRIRLNELERERAYSERRSAELGAEIDKQESILDEQSGQLANQLKAAWMSGDQEKLQLLLNQKDPATLGRLVVYYDYLNEYRSENIRSITDALARLTALRAEVVAEAARLTDIAKRRYDELTELNAAQEKRQSLLSSLKQRMATESEEIERLAAEERDLTRLIDELSSILSDYPIRSEEPFREFKGRLTWPVAGQLQHDFGQPRVGGELRWNGVVLLAPRGREVRAVYHGRVVFADWLAGMGLLVIVDHGDGYMTLYGYNETVLTDEGDWVAPGDVIATVGNSGGQAESALYFEIRRGQDPVNPGDWVTRQPGAAR